MPRVLTFSTLSTDMYENSTTCIERIVHGFSLNPPPPELPPALLNILNQHNNIYFRSFNAAVDLDETLEADGIVDKNCLLSLSSAEKIKEIESFENLDLEVQFLVRFRFTGLYVNPSPVFHPETRY